MKRPSLVPVRGLAGLFYGAGEAISENNVRARSLAISKRLEHHVVTPLWEWCAIPRTVEGDERTSPVGNRELIAKTVKSTLDAQIDELAGNEPS